MSSCQSSIPIRPITGRHSLFPLSFTRCRVESPLRCLYPEGRHRAYHVLCTCLCGLGPTYSPVAQRLRQTRLHRLFLATHLLVQAYQHLSLVNFHDVYQWFTYVDPTAPSWLPTALVLAIAASARAFAAARFYGWGYIVPGASHLTVTSDARPGRIPLAEQRVMSFV